MGLSWQQGPLSEVSVGRFLTPEPLPQRLLFVEPLRRRLRAKLAGEWIAESEDVLLLHEPGRYPVAYFPIAAVHPGLLVSETRTTQHRDLGDTAWFTLVVGDRRAAHSAWQFTALPDYASELRERVAFAWRGVDAFYEEDDRIVGHAAVAFARDLNMPRGQQIPCHVRSAICSARNRCAGAHFWGFRLHLLDSTRVRFVSQDQVLIALKRPSSARTERSLLAEAVS